VSLVSVARQVGRVVFCVVMGTCFAVALVLGIGWATSASAPTYWGTFTEHSCTTPSRLGCQSVGTWVSDDGSITRTNIAFDGSLHADGVARASYRPTGFNNDRDLNIVHSEFGSSAKYWFPWVFAAGVAAGVTVQWRTWRRQDRRRRLIGAPVRTRA
jgi:hypothetical protein